MTPKEAIAKLKQLDVEGAADLASAIEAGFSDLEAKNFTVIGEKRTESTKRQSLETALVAVGKVLGIEGDVDKMLAEVEPKVKAISTEAEQLRTEKASFTTRATEAEGKLQTLERKSKLAEIATKAGANAAVLEKLLGDKFDELKVDGDEVKLGDKPLKEAIASDEGLKPFENALFPPTTTTTTKTTTQLPNGSPKGATPETANPVTGYIQRNSRVKALAKGKQD